MERPLAIAVSAGLVIGALAWIDPLFIPLVLAGPLVTGALAGSRGTAFRWVALAWVVGGVSMLVSDWVLNDEDQAFHAVLTAVMVALAGVGYAVASRRTRRGTRPVVSRG